MKIININTFDTMGGAARAAYRLHGGFIKSNIDSTLIVKHKISDNYTVLKIHSKTQKYTDIVQQKLNNFLVTRYKNRTQSFFSSAFLPFSNIAKKINELNPDIVHLHWITGGMIGIEDLSKIRAPLVWTLHDMWAFTGGCHYDSNCDKYIKKCELCPILGSRKNGDLSSIVFARKKRTFEKIKDLTLVGPSKWITECAKGSFLLGNRYAINIPNPIDTETFCPIDKQTARQILELPADKKIVLFGALNAMSDRRKGFNELSKSLDTFHRKDVEFAIFGTSRPEHPHPFRFPVRYFGRLNDDISLRILYNAADVMVVPSLQENLSNVIIESLSCGTPVVAFDIGGNTDMIEHQLNGYLAIPLDTDDLARGIDWVLDNSDYSKIAKNAREKVLNEFEMTKVVRKYINLYEEIFAKK